MNQTEYTDLLQQGQAVNKEQVDDLNNIIEEFPYFQSARALYLKGLNNLESFKYNQALKTTAAYTTDRSVLFDFITSKDFQQNEISKFIQHNSEHLKNIDVDCLDISTYKSKEIDAALEQQISDTKDLLDPNLFEPKEKRQTSNNQLDSTSNIEPEENKTPKDVLNIGKPLQFDKTETHSFNEWLNLTHFKPIERDKKQEKEEKEEQKKAPSKEKKSNLLRLKKFELIDQFITKNPKIKPAHTNVSNHNIAKQQMIQPESLMTETLARIYVEQKNYKKAIQSYKILSLKYPEKSGFFADQIKAVKQIQEQNKTK